MEVCAPLILDMVHDGYIRTPASGPAPGLIIWTVDTWQHPRGVLGFRITGRLSEWDSMSSAGSQQPALV